MSLLIGFLTFVLVMTCIFLILLVLIQLPKKEAGAGIAFGGAATDALFGAGSGNALTKMTKYTATFFVLLSVLLSVMNTHYARQGSRRLEQELSKQASSSAPALPLLPPSSNVTVQAQTQVQPPVTSMSNILTTTPSAVTNLLVSPTTQAPATPPPGSAAPSAEAPAPQAPAPAPAK